MGARWYYAKVGGFVSADPLALSTGFKGQRWAYAIDNPLTNLDPSGLITLCIDTCGPKPRIHSSPAHPLFPVITIAHFKDQHSSHLADAIGQSAARATWQGRTATAGLGWQPPCWQQLNTGPGCQPITEGNVNPEWVLAMCGVSGGALDISCVDDALQYAKDVWNASINHTDPRHQDPDISNPDVVSEADALGGLTFNKSPFTKSFVNTDVSGGSTGPSDSIQEKPSLTPVVSKPLPSPGRTYYHGTSVDSGLSLLNGADLDPAVAAAAKIDGPPGFFLATEADAAAYFAARRHPGTVLRYEISDDAISGLIGKGAHIAPIPPGRFPGELPGQELVIPPALFDEFNTLRDAGQIAVTPYPIP